HKPFDRLMEWENWTEMTNNYSYSVEQAGIKDFEPMLKEALSFPHYYIQQVCWRYEEFSGTPMTQNNTAADWFEAIVRTNDLQFIVQNVEARIAREIGEQIDGGKLNPELWQMYIKYLLTKDLLLAVEVYYRFRRLFINDRSLASYFPNFCGKLSAKAKSAMEEMKYSTPYVFKVLPSAPLTIYNSPAARQYLRITSQTFYVNEYDFLTSGGKIMKLVFRDVSIFEENGESIVLEHFLYNLPLAVYIE
uniref:Uncharacterized protein n=1 Tax=Panagrolaimus sp. PS1159 TaxID=55785 RepID=A0AC35GN90_9BILA